MQYMHTWFAVMVRLIVVALSMLLPVAWWLVFPGEYLPDNCGVDIGRCHHVLPLVCIEPHLTVTGTVMKTVTVMVTIIMVDICVP